MYNRFFKPITTQTISYTGTSVSTTNVTSAQIEYVRLVSTSGCHVLFDEGTATTSDAYLPADVPEVFKVSRAKKISAVQNTTSGTLFVTELSQ